jgi:TM2 domain-containing membrane protein YozV
MKKKVLHTAPAIISAFFPGAGQIMKGEVGKGVGVMAMYVLSWLMCLLIIGFVLVPIVWVWAIYDSYNAQV